MPHARMITMARVAVLPCMPRPLTCPPSGVRMFCSCHSCYGCFGATPDAFYALRPVLHCTAPLDVSNPHTRRAHICDDAGVPFECVDCLHRVEQCNVAPGVKHKRHQESKIFLRTLQNALVLVTKQIASPLNQSTIRKLLRNSQPNTTIDKTSNTGNTSQAQRIQFCRRI